MSSWAMPGQKVVCIDANPDRFVTGDLDWLDDFHLQEREVYTIRSVTKDPDFGYLCVKLYGLRDRSPEDYGYAASRFRPLTKSTKTQEEDIAMFWDIMAEEGEKV